MILQAYIEYRTRTISGCDRPARGAVLLGFDHGNVVYSTITVLSVQTDLSVLSSPVIAAQHPSGMCHRRIKGAITLLEYEFQSRQTPNRQVKVLYIDNIRR